MSEYARFTTEFRDQDALVEALKQVGYETVECHEKAEHLVGYHGDQRKQTANVIVRREYVGGASNDIGFLKKPDGTYEAIISDYDRHQHNNQWLGRLKQEYVVAQKVKTFTRNGLVQCERKLVQTATGPRVQVSFFKR